MKYSFWKTIFYHYRKIVFGKQTSNSSHFKVDIFSEFWISKLHISFQLNPEILLLIPRCANCYLELLVTWDLRSVGAARVKELAICASQQNIWIWLRVKILEEWSHNKKKQVSHFPYLPRHSGFKLFCV